VEQSSTFTLREIFHVVFKRKWIITLLFASTVTTVALASLMFGAPMYEATSQILLRAGREHLPDMPLPNATAEPLRVNFDLEEQSARTIEMLTGSYLSEQVVNTIGPRKLCRERFRWPSRFLASTFPNWPTPFCTPGLSDDKLMDRVAARVQSDIRAQRLGTSALINLRYQHQDPDLAAAVVNTLASLYLERYIGVLNNPRSQAFLTEQFGLQKQRLAQAERDLADFKQRNGMSSGLREEHDIILRQRTTLQAEHGETTSREAETASRIGQLKAELVKRGTLNPRIQEELLRHETELKGVRARRLAQEGRLGELQVKARKLDTLTAEFDRLAQRADVEQQNYRMYLAKAEESRITNAMGVEKIASFKIVERARPPLKPVGSKMGLKLVLAAFLGALGGLIIAFLLELFSDRLETAERAENVLGVPVLASFPALRFK